MKKVLIIKSVEMTIIEMGKKIEIHFVAYKKV
jgi:hypothetical protein